MRRTTRLARLTSLFLAAAMIASACASDDDAADPGNPQEITDPTPANGSADGEATDDGEAEPDQDPESDEAPEPEQESESSGGTLVIALADDPGHFNPGITTGFNVHAVTGSIFNGLVELDDNANPLPDLATSWEVNADSTVYAFTLAEDVRWHDGTRFTSGDVKFTFENVLLQFHSRTKSGLENILESITTPDDATVVFTFSQPYAALLQRLNSTEAPILPRHIYEGVDDVQTAPQNLTPVGTGPFVFESYDVDDQVTLVGNDDYFKDGLPLLDRVVFRIIPDANTQLLALEEGEVDYMWRVPGAEVERLSTSDAITLYQANSGPGGGFCVPSLSFNLDREVFADVRVRQAIAHAIDQQQLLDQAIFGQGRIATGPISSQMAFAYTDDVTRYPRDLDLANELLDEAGLAGDSRPTLTLLLFPNFVKYGEIIRENLAEAGIDVDLQPLERSAFLPRVFGERDFDMNVISYCNNTDPSIGVSRMYVSDNIGDIPFSNAAGYVNADIDDLFNQAASTADVAQRSELYRQIQQLLVDELPYWWLLETQFVIGASSLVEGLQPHSGHVAETAQFVDG